jgi:hypothetical protein
MTSFPIPSAGIIPSLRDVRLIAAAILCVSMLCLWSRFRTAVRLRMDAKVESGQTFYSDFSADSWRFEVVICSSTQETDDRCNIPTCGLYNIMNIGRYPSGL